jgi:hypothetical protein
MIVDVFAFDGELVEVMQIEGGRISVRDGRERWRTLSLTAFLSRAIAAGEHTPVPALRTVMAALSTGQRDVLTGRARHVREVLTGTGPAARTPRLRVSHAALRAWPVDAIPAAGQGPRAGCHGPHCAPLGAGICPRR